MKSSTKLLHLRVNVEDANAGVTPLFQCSGFEAGSPYFYTRKNNPNIQEFEEVVAVIENAKHCVAVTTGMSALALAVDLLRAGDTLVINRNIYGCSYKLFQRVSQQRGINLQVLDLSRASEVAQIDKSVRMVLFETPTNPFLQTIDIRKVSSHVKGLNPDSLVVVDNTWASPIFQHPLEHGADVSIHSATKYLSGHTDVMGGAILTDCDDLDREFRDARFYQGAILDPHSAWLLRRSLQTLKLRMDCHAHVTAEMREFLGSLPQVERVYYPEIDGEQLLGYGGILFFDLPARLADRYSDFARALSVFGTGTGMACVTSMVAQPYNGSHASMTAEEKAAMKLGPQLVRLCFGLEDMDDLKADLRHAFDRLEKSR